MTETRKYELETLESEYRNLTTNGDLASAVRMRSVLAMIRYDLSNETEVIMEYRDGFPEPLVMRIMHTEKDLDRWVEQRFVRLAEF